MNQPRKPLLFFSKNYFNFFTFFDEFPYSKELSETCTVRSNKNFKSWILHFFKCLTCFLLFFFQKSVVTSSESKTLVTHRVYSSRKSQGQHCLLITQCIWGTKPLMVSWPAFFILFILFVFISSAVNGR